MAFLKCSPKQMAGDTRELEDITNYLEKLQETVNVNNWDDIVDNFMCLYDLHTQLKGERSCAIFLSIWKDEKLRKSIAVADKFQKVVNVNDPPAFIIHEVKNAVGHVKKNATAWKIAMKKEVAAIDLIKARQQAFFQFLISCISGVFVFLATLFSGLVLDAMEAGKVNVPLLSDLLNSTGNL